MPKPINTYEIAHLQPVQQAKIATTEAVKFAPGIINLPYGSIVEEGTTVANAVHTLAANGATGGTFRLSWRGFTSSLLNFNDTASVVVAALNALASIAVLGAVVGSGTAVNGAGLVLTWSGGAFANSPIELPVIIPITPFTGAAISMTSTTQGSAVGLWAPSPVGASNARGITQYRISTNAASEITIGDSANGDEWGSTFLTIPVYIDGFFALEDLQQAPISGITGGILNAQKVSELGKITQGSLAVGRGILKLGV